MNRTAVQVEDLTRIVEFSEVRLSPDGSMVAAATATPDADSNTYRRQVLLGPTDRPGGLIPVGAADRDATRMPRWSSDGRWLAVVAGGPDGDRIDLVEVATGRTHTLLHAWPDPIGELSWSPDGRRLLFVVREPTDRQWYETDEARRPPLRLTGLRYREDAVEWTVNRPRQAYLVDVDPRRTDDVVARPVKLSVGGFDDAEFSWRPDSAAVYFVSQRHPRADRSPLNDVFVQPLDGQPRPLTATASCYGNPLPSPDGTRLAITVVDVVGYPAATHLAVLDQATGEITDLAADLDRDCRAPVWLDNERVAAIVDDAGAIDVLRFEPATGGVTSITGHGRRRVTAFDAAGERTALVTSGPVDPPALVVRDAAGTETTIASPNADYAASVVLASPSHAAIEVADGIVVDSWLVLPAGGSARPAVADDADDTDGAVDGDHGGPSAAGTLPLILWLQGGGSQYGYQFSHEVQLLAAAGYAVLYLNPRGSAGYGTDWMRTVSGPRAARPGSGWGTVDVADVAAVVSATLAAHPQLDPARVGVMGGSYGGLVTTHLLAQTDLFAAGWAERGPYNLFSDAGTKDEAPWFFDAYLGSSHLQDPESYWRASPIRLVEQITAPLAIVHSEKDRRCSIGQAEELFMALKLLDREVEFIRFPGECHELTRSGGPVHRLQRSEILLEWFGRHLRPGAAGQR